MQEKKPPHILHVLPDFDPGGLQRGVLDRISWLHEHEIKSSTASSGGSWVGKLSERGISHLELPLNTGNPLKIYSCAGEIRNLIDNTGINFVCAYGPGPSWASHLATIASPIHEPPLVTYADNFNKPGVFSNAITHGDRIIAVSKIVREHLVSILNARDELVTTITRGFSDETYTTPDTESRKRLRRDWEISDSAPLLAGIGRFVESEGWEILIEAISLIPDPKPHLVLVGSSYNAQKKYIASLQEKIEHLGLAGTPGKPPLVRFAGHFDNVEDIYATADLVVVPNLTPRPFGQVILESLIFDCPVITPLGSGACDKLMPTMKDFLVEAGSAKSLAEKITHVLEDLDSALIRTRWLAKAVRETLTVNAQMKTEMKIFEALAPEIDWPSN